jgi:hypothetical protein
MCCHTSRTVVTKSCSHLTHSSYMDHHSNIPAPHPLHSDAIRAWFSQTRRLNQCRDHQWKLQQEKYNKGEINVTIIKQLLLRIASFCNYDKGEITWGRSWWWPSLRGRTPSVSLSSMSVRLFALGCVMFPSLECLTPPLLFGILC